MTLALLPLGLISIWQTSVVVQEAEALSRASLLSRTKDEASEEQRLVQQALGAAQGMASVALSLDAERCSRAMQRLVDENPDYIFAGFVPSSGRMSCSSVDVPVDLTSEPGFDTFINRSEPFVEVSASGAVTGQPVLIITHAVVDDSGLQGRITISIPHWRARETLNERDAASGLKIASFNSAGDLIATTQGVKDPVGYLPQDIALEDLPARSNTTFRALSNDGRQRLFAVAPLVPGTLYLVGSWPIKASNSIAPGLASVSPILFPALMWVAGLGVAVLGLQHLVIRHITVLRSAMRQFGLGERDADGLELINPPREFEDTERAFNRMTRILSEAEARQKADLRDKEVLLREVHHRVKNNLQLIASIMNMQMRRAQSTEAKLLLSGLQQRVRGLAMLHRTLYTTTDVSTIDSKELVETVAMDASNLIPDSKMEVVTDLQSFPLYPDQAVPLSMLVAEALTNAFKYSDASEVDTVIRVILEEHANNVARLMITNPIGDVEDDYEIDTGDKLGSQLLKAFIRQLDGTAHSGIRNGLFVFEITFERRDFEGHRNAG
ncbi:sensor histidine kinase [Marivita sp. S0852]|uniref:sensor histidine kinase n=1 Tax=Marivita sp. S0852 TaxID=3373893 RepID=UPI003982337C